MEVGVNKVFIYNYRDSQQWWNKNVNFDSLILEFEILKSILQFICYIKVFSIYLLNKGGDRLRFVDF